MQAGARRTGRSLNLPKPGVARSSRAGGASFLKTYAPSRFLKSSQNSSTFTAPITEKECQPIDFFDSVAESVLRKRKPCREAGGAFLLDGIQ